MSRSNGGPELTPAQALVGVTPLVHVDGTPPSQGHRDQIACSSQVSVGGSLAFLSRWCSCQQLLSQPFCEARYRSVRSQARHQTATCVWLRAPRTTSLVRVLQPLSPELRRRRSVVRARLWLALFCLPAGTATAGVASVSSAVSLRSLSSCVPVHHPASSDSSGRSHSGPCRC